LCVSLKSLHAVCIIKMPKTRSNFNQLASCRYVGDLNPKYRLQTESSSLTLYSRNGRARRSDQFSITFTSARPTVVPNLKLLNVYENMIAVTVTVLIVFRSEIY
jgi:hypothetical protein